MNFYISFGQAHAHRINNRTYDCDSLMLVQAETEIAARLHVRMLTGGLWSGTYKAEDLPDVLRYFPRGVINVDDPIIVERMEPLEGSVNRPPIGDF